MLIYRTPCSIAVTTAVSAIVDMYFSLFVFTAEAGVALWGAHLLEFEARLYALFDSVRSEARTARSRDETSSSTVRS